MRDRDSQEARERVKAMSTGQRMKYYVGYYKVPAIVILIVAIGLGFLIRDIVNNPEELMYIGVVNSGSVDDEKLITDLCERLGADKKQTVAVYAGLSSDADFESGDIYNKLSIYLATDEMDVIFADEEGIRYLALSGALGNPDLWMTEDYKANWGDRVCVFEALDRGTGVSDDDTYADLPVAIDITDTPIMEALGLDENTHYMAVVDYSNRLERIQVFCDYLCELQ